MTPDDYRLRLAVECALFGDPSPDWLVAVVAGVTGIVGFALGLFLR